MDLILQPKGSNVCGQCVVAMVAGVSLEKAIEAVGHSNGTSPADIAKALRKFGVPVPQEDAFTVRPNVPLPPRCVLHVSWDDYHHWVLRWNDVEYDPLGGAKHGQVLECLVIG